MSSNASDPRYHDPSKTREINHALNDPTLWSPSSTELANFCTSIPPFQNHFDRSSSSQVEALEATVFQLKEQLKQVQGEVEALREDMENLAEWANGAPQWGKSMTKASEPFVERKLTVQRGKPESVSFVKAWIQETGSDETEI